MFDVHFAPQNVVRQGSRLQRKCGIVARVVDASAQAQAHPIVATPCGLSSWNDV